MEVSFLPPDLRRFDDARAEAIALTLCTDQRPLPGALGLVDWRMAGALSRQVFRGRITGGEGEVVLVPSERRFPFEKIFVFGAGPSDAFDFDVYREVVARMLRTLAAARVRASLCSLPGRAVTSAEDAAQMFLEEARGMSELDEVTLIESASAQRAMEPILAHERRRERAGTG